MAVAERGHQSWLVSSILLPAAHSWRTNKLLYNCSQGYSSISDLLPPLQRSPEGELITPCVLNSAGVDVMELLYQRRLLPRKKMADSEGKDCHATESSEACNGTCHSKPVDAPATKTSPSVLVVQAEQGDSAHKQPR
ncbi:uncharacterized protein LOC108677936 [Hyalella azteca]|uniref:Uncharacterized protein LOC108677936 n=1 Tax=Hyalella azteca TaxID=294128 RepID=A0A8B7P798_HYAAZ|nr:uncharacterized protein LOC108677936 [Hyalella azteca]